MTEEAASDKLNAIMKQADDLYQAAVKLQTITVKPLNLGLGDQSGKLIGAEAENWVKRIQAAYKTEETLINSAATLFGMSEKQKTDILLTELQKREDMEVAALAKARDANKSNPLEYKKYEDQITLIKAKATEDRTKLVTRELEAEQKIWTQAADTIAGAFNSQLHGLLSGTTTWAQAMKNIAVSLIESMISEIVKLGVEWAVNMVFMATAGKGMAAAAAASFVSRLNADAALVFGGVFANMAPELGPAAAGPAAAAQAAVEAQLVNVPKFAVGTDYVPQDMLAMLHQGERVVPAAQNTTNFGNQSLSLNVSAMDGRSVANMFFNNRAFMQQMLNLLARNNPSNVSRLVGSV
jgi:hypothetical protein